MLVIDLQLRLSAHQGSRASRAKGNSASGKRAEVACPHLQKTVSHTGGRVSGPGRSQQKPPPDTGDELAGPSGHARSNGRSDLPQSSRRARPASARGEVGTEPRGTSAGPSRQQHAADTPGAGGHSSAGRGKILREVKRLAQRVTQKVPRPSNVRFLSPPQLRPRPRLPPAHKLCAVFTPDLSEGPAQTPEERFHPGALSESEEGVAL